MHGERAAPAGRAFHLHTAPVDLDHVLDNGQTQARPSHSSTSGFIHAVESFEDAIQVFTGNAGAPVRHADRDLGSGLHGLHQDPHSPPGCT